jgi:hypothetical protein
MRGGVEDEGLAGVQQATEEAAVEVGEAGLCRHFADRVIEMRDGRVDPADRIGGVTSRRPPR